MQALTPSERRGALVLVLLLALGAVHDQLARRAAPPAPPAPTPATSPRVSVGPAAGEPVGGGVPPGAAPGADPVDLNRADATALDALPGIGPVLAARIVEHRARYGPFRRVDELLAVRGIGRRLLARIAPRVRVGPAPPDSGGARGP